MKELGAGFEKYLNIEPSQEGARLTRNKGFEVINDFVENVEELNADCICAFELIEHVFNPLSFCRHIRKLLNRGGIFVLTIPNIEGFDLILLNNDSDNVAAPNHLNYFNPNSIKILLKRAGFRVIAIETPGVLDVDIVKNKIADGYKINDRFVSFLFTKRVDALNNFQKFLQENNLSSNMFIVAQKV